MKSVDILGGKVQLYRRGNNRNWHCCAYMNGKQHRVSSKLANFEDAKLFAEDWYLELRGKSRAGLLKPNEKTFAQAAKQFLKEYTAITDGERSEKWVESYEIRLRLHLLPFFGNLGLSEVTSGKVQDYRVMRAGQAGRQPKNGTANGKVKPPSRSTIEPSRISRRVYGLSYAAMAWLSRAA